MLKPLKIVVTSEVDSFENDIRMIIVQVTGGVAPYEVTLDQGEPQVGVGPYFIFRGLTANYYSVVVTDASPVNAPYYKTVATR